MKSQIKILFILFVVLAAVLAYASFSKGDNDEVLIKKVRLADGAVSDSEAVAPNPVPESHPLDTTSQNILLLGESMVEGLSRPFADYCAANGHQFNAVCWYSSTTKHWAQTDTLQYFLQKFNPTYVLITIGGNEQFAKDLDVREKYIRRIIDQLQGRKFVWLGTPAWKQDTGINDLTLKIVGQNRYFDGRNLKLDRKKDHAHPTTQASLQWMDEAARWLSSENTLFPIKMEKYTEHSKDKHLVVLQPMDI